MKKALYVFCVMFLTLSTSLYAQWETYISEDFNIKFQVPEIFETVTGVEGEVPYLVSMAPDNSMGVVVYMYEDETIAPEDLFHTAVELIDFRGEGEFEEVDINGFNAHVGAGWGTVDGGEVGLVLMTATTEYNNFIIYAFTGDEFFDENADIIEKIIYSFAPLD